MKKLEKGRNLIRVIMIFSFFMSIFPGAGVSRASCFSLRKPLSMSEGGDQYRFEGVMMNLRKFNDRTRAINQIKVRKTFDSMQEALLCASGIINTAKIKRPVIFLLDSENHARGKSTLRQAIMNQDAVSARRYNYTVDMFDPREIEPVSDNIFHGQFDRIRKGADVLTHELPLAYQLLLGDAKLIKDNHVLYDRYLGHYINNHLSALLKSEDKNILLWDEASSDSYFTGAMAYQPLLEHPVEVVCLKLMDNGAASVISWHWGEVMDGESGSAYVTPDGIRINEGGKLLARVKLGEQYGYYKESMHQRPAVSIARALMLYRAAIQDEKNLGPGVDFSIECGKIDRKSDDELVPMDSLLGGILTLALKKGEDVEIVLKPVGELSAQISLFIIREVARALKDENYAHLNYDGDTVYGNGQELIENLIARLKQPEQKSLASNDSLRESEGLVSLDRSQPRWMDVLGHRADQVLFSL